jgi:hypothetical protein
MLRPRFSIRTLAIVVTLVCAYFGAWEATKKGRSWIMRAFQMFALTTLTLVFPATLVGARPVPAWSYKTLFEESDLVVVVEPIAVRDATVQDKLIPPSGQREHFVGVVTSFKVLAIVKGKIDQQSLQMKHFTLKAESKGLGNPPEVVSFKYALPDPQKAPCTFMLFLRRLPNGDLEFVTGQVDPAFSVKQLKEFPYPLPD